MMLYIIGGVIIYFVIGIIYEICLKKDPTDTEFEIGIRVTFWIFSLLISCIVGIVFIFIFCMAMIGRIISLIKIKREKKPRPIKTTGVVPTIIDKEEYLPNEKIEF